MSKTAGIIIIGDEILNGKVVDTNSSFLCKQFHAQGIRVCRISTIPDQLDAIEREVKSFSDTFDFVVTTGGVGPTHDDVTYEGVASAFQVPLRRDEQMLKYFATYLEESESADPSVAKLITVPSSADVIMSTDLEYSLGGLDYYPVVRTRNVFCLPGIPKYVRALFPALVPNYFRSSTMYFSRTIHLVVDEIHAVTVLNELVEKFANSVTFGAYPLVGESQVECAVTKITIESTTLADCLEAERLLISRLPPLWITYPRVEVVDFALIQRLNSLETEFSHALNTSYQIIEQSFNQFTVDETLVSFNGGKDCTVLLNLVCAFCVQRKLKQRLKLLYFQETDAFPEVDEFIGRVAKEYNVDVCTLPMPMKDSLRSFLSRESNRKACFMGLRNTDPKSEHLKPIQETDSDWPKIVRISPILHWTYKNIWDFLRCTNVPYCSLYNKGFSSLGNRNNTVPNPALQFTAEDGTVHYRPAFFLEDRLERQSRNSATNSSVV